MNGCGTAAWAHGGFAMLGNAQNALAAAVYGDPRDVYASQSSWFEYDSPYFVNHAERDFCIDDGYGSQAHPISSSSALIEEEQCDDSSRSGILRPNESPYSNLQNIPIVDDISRVRHRPFKGTHIRGPVLTPSTNVTRESENKGYESDAVVDDIRDTPVPSSGNTLAPTSSLLSPIVINSHSQRTSQHSSKDSQSTFASPLTYIKPADAVDSLTIPCIPLTTHIRLCLCGELFSYDLNNLLSDPREIIELLKCTGSERGNWMMVGAFYRRRGNVHAAIAVIESMLEVMTQRGISDNGLKPAYLLLSGCETDLSKLTRRDEESIADQHQRKAQSWLQKVYGAMKDAPAHQSDDNDHPSSLPLKIGETTRSSTASSDEDLRRELQSLRDRLNHQVGLLTEVRSAKRKLEQSYNQERATRRKLEREIQSLKAGWGGERRR
ncbi:hypothetical protein F5880DRAFT_1299787 [Lentinula raphanica]|nr:hypothetical protein F5880DRAFT_1299787 [Lentinula raphanica]